MTARIRRSFCETGAPVVIDLGRFVSCARVVVLSAGMAN